MASASLVYSKRLHKHQKPRNPLIFKGFPGLFCIKVERVLDVACGDGDRFTSEGMLVRVRIEGDEAHGFTVTNTVESAETLPATGVDSPVALAGAGLLVSVAGMAATWLVARRRTRNR